MTRVPSGLVLLSVLLCGCSASDSTADAADSVSVAVVEESFVTRRHTLAIMDSPAIWAGHTGETWIVATGKLTSRLYVSDAATGAPVRTIGRRGSGLGEFRRPNGIAVSGDLLMVVERDNHRVQVLRLPDAKPVASFGEATLSRPYGIAVDNRGNGDLSVFVTDNYEAKNGRALADRDLGERVKRYRVAASNQGLVVTYLGAFGDTAGAGRLLGVESLAVDRDAGILLIADELAVDVKVYRTDGSFTGQVLWGDVIRHEPEGIALYACGPTEGYWIVTDQHPVENRFLVFHRETFALVGVFTGAAVRNTDGIALVQRPVGSMSAGALYAAHKDRSIAAISWSRIAAALGLRSDCAA